MSNISQSQIRNLAITTILEAGTKGRPGDVAVIQETGAVYHLATGAYTVDNLRVIASGLSGSYWIATSAFPTLSGWSPLMDYAQDSIVLFQGHLVKANGFVAASTGFMWGTTVGSASWSYIGDASAVFYGVYSSLVSYPASAIVAGSNDLLYKASVAVSADAAKDPVSGTNASMWTPVLGQEAPSFQGSSASSAGKTGLVPAPTITQSTLFLRGDGTWSSAGLAAWNPLTNYLLGDQAVWSGYYVQANGAQASGAPFNWGTGGATWAPILPSSYTWAGLFTDTGVAYAVNEVVSDTATGALYVCNTAIASSDATYNPSTGTNKNFWTPWFTVSSTFIGATSTTNGQQGIVPAPVAGQQMSFLRADGTWVATTPSLNGYTSAAAYSASTTVEYIGYLISANGAIASNTPFAWGTSGATWAPVVDTSTVWKGAFSAASTYALGDVVAASTTGGLFVCTTAVAIAGSANNPATGTNRKAWAPWLTNTPQTFLPSTSTLPGQPGLVPFSAIANQDARLLADSTWDNVERLSAVTLPNFAASGVIGAPVSTIDVAATLVIQQTTKSIALTLPVPSVNKSRRLTILNAGSASITIAGIRIPSLNEWVFNWDATALQWIPMQPPLLNVYTPVAAGASEALVARKSYLMGIGSTAIFPDTSQLDDGECIELAPTSADWTSANVTLTPFGTDTIALGQGTNAFNIANKATFIKSGNNWIMFA
jgi:hypothetical protein